MESQGKFHNSKTSRWGQLRNISRMVQYSSSDLICSNWILKTLFTPCLKLKSSLLVLSLNISVHPSRNKHIYGVNQVCRHPETPNWFEKMFILTLYLHSWGAYTFYLSCSFTFSNVLLTCSDVIELKLAPAYRNWKLAELIRNTSIQVDCEGICFTTHVDVCG